MSIYDLFRKALQEFLSYSPATLPSHKTKCAIPYSIAVYVLCKWFNCSTVMEENQFFLLACKSLFFLLN